MKIQLIKSNGFLITIAVLLVLTFALSLSAQNRSKGAVKQPAAESYAPVEDTSMNPHDFTNKFYMLNGVDADFIIGRRTGFDFLSVFGWSSNPYHRNIRVTATLPAYGAEGEILFFSPLGEINEKGFTDDRIGWEAKELADTFPIYVFPANNSSSFSFSTMRQAVLMDASVFSPNADGYPIGLRAITLVNYTKKAFSDEGVEMMSYMTKKNGTSLDGTPLIRSTDDLVMLGKHELISMEKRTLWDDTDFAGTYSLSPIIYQPLKGGIAKDAFLITVQTEKGALPDEQRFIDEFNCLRKGGNWCSEL